VKTGFPILSSYEVFSYVTQGAELRKLIEGPRLPSILQLFSPWPFESGRKRVDRSRVQGSEVQGSGLVKVNKKSNPEPLNPER